MGHPLSGKRVLVGVTGGIAAYKSAELVRLLVKDGAQVHVCMTRSATQFITPLTVPTIYFPINIPESIMIEPTETESRETLEAFASAMIEIDNNIDENRDFLKEAPYSTPVRRLNETLANRELDVRYKDDVQ